MLKHSILRILIMSSTSIIICLSLFIVVLVTTQISEAIEKIEECRDYLMTTPKEQIEPEKIRECRDHLMTTPKEEIELENILIRLGFNE